MDDKALSMAAKGRTYNFTKYVDITSILAKKCFLVSFCIHDYIYLYKGSFLFFYITNNTELPPKNAVASSFLKCCLLFLII